MKQSLLVALLSLAAFSDTATAALASDATIARFEKIDTGEFLPYRLLRPENFDPTVAYPVIISLHGASGTANYPNNVKNVRDWNEHFVRDDIRAEFNCYIFIPHSPGAWNLDQFAVMKQIIEALPAVDLDRIYILGHSMGGQGVYTYIQEEPEYFAAAGCSSAKGGRITDQEKIKDLPLWTVHGDNDGTIDIIGNIRLFGKMEKVGGNMKFTTLLGEGHGSSEHMVSLGSAYEQFKCDKDNFVFYSADLEYETQLSSELCDPEPNFMKWLFSKRRPPLAVFNAWAKAHGLSEGLEGDDDRDNVTNLAEFALGGDPMDPTDAGSLLTLTPRSDGGNGLDCSFAQRSSPGSGLVYRVEQASELSSSGWSSGISTEVERVRLNDELERVTHRIGGAFENPVFLRVSVVSAPTGP